MKKKGGRGKERGRGRGIGSWELGGVGGMLAVEYMGKIYLSQTIQIKGS